MKTTAPKRLPVVRDIVFARLVDDRHWVSDGRMSAHEARTAIRSWRRDGATVHVYRTTDRDGLDLHVAYARSAPGYWSRGETTVDIYEIPTESLLAL
ncbi:hypothetical protein OG871_17010 [Kitasatospora sp. NBC_00374]|uniref:hypothetical protein n=1 Tax=Kitasatospora sp. NBC_00374 TaxID=2975964 RepID=UPI0030E03F65